MYSDAANSYGKKKDRLHSSIDGFEILKYRALQLLSCGANELPMLEGEIAHSGSIGGVCLAGRGGRCDCTGAHRRTNGESVKVSPSRQGCTFNVRAITLELKTDHPY